MLFAGKVVAATIMRLMDNPALIEQAKAEHFEKTGGQYFCNIPAYVKPATPENSAKNAN
jgi:aminobenzoyl-glutamate utilization protein B